MPTAPPSSRVRDKTPEINAARITPSFEVSPLHATGTSKPSHPEGLVSQSPLAPLFADAIPVPYVPKWNITPSTVVGTPETARDFLAHVLWCRVTNAEWGLLEEKGVGVMLEQRERAWTMERSLIPCPKGILDTMYAEWGMVVDDNQKLAKESYWLITEGFGSFLTVVSQSEEFKGSLERIYRAYRDVRYQSGLKDGYAYSAQGLGRKETPIYNSKAKKQLSKLDKEFGEKTPALLEKILERPLMSIDELKSLLTPVGPSSP
ncbi:hypothetical protein Hdeb2414_s0028g00698611 [Helianthus debilis subsp. tardiflorus]